ncbi:MAG TPA: ADP-ribosylglycohydrolase family protein [Chitinivibrionales bacterium]|nr:ADP-ribosylglycohydrolase family protein [Chitinivibrionales bacterium]
MGLTKKMKAALYAGIAGDALGVPVESSTRQQLALCSVKNMLGYGRYDQPEGTWSDDTALVLCTMENLAGGYDLEAMGKTFCNWLFESYWTPTGFVFDAGLTTYLALDRIYHDGASAAQSGCTGEDDNGNGSLMRMLPVALYFHDSPTEDLLARAHEISAITHAHTRSKVGCGIYCLLVQEMLSAGDREQAYHNAVSRALAFYSAKPEYRNELSHYMRIISFAVPGLKESEIRSSGYLVDTLEAALWCTLTHSTTRDVLLSAVNLGLDTDTTGMVAGGMAGALYGLDSVPADWLASLARKDELDVAIDRFVNRAAAKTARSPVGVP